jgi:hypothetical protein
MNDDPLRAPAERWRLLMQELGDRVACLLVIVAVGVACVLGWRYLSTMSAFS